ncbi:uncharacterized protein FSUBG_4135 [Fusarium subglutinans]|uniref:DUF7908 domain-containing protein n=1 Tax=Gibberella subglutinans TaxID=42677 RepID=A0A8H5Q631_GIBSU|nr:uncharacterized protein FSUBG_4135 [Fusarium subglutinans]KAF5609342.1 hypothetical protein FSUBG_4135 [Fusarium subglutinans]
MSRRLGSLLLSGLIAQTGAQHVVNEPDTVCVTYLSTYLVPVSSNVTGSVPMDGANSTSQTFDAALSASTTFGSGTGPSLDLTETLQTTLSLSDGTSQLIITSVTTDTNTANSDPTTAPGPGDQLVVFRIVPDTDNSRRRRLRRAIGGFVGSTSEICQDASAFSLSDGRLFDGANPIYYNGEEFKELGGQQATVPRGAVAATFSGDGGFLRFRSPELPSGEAGFCQSPGTGLVYITFTSSPPSCVSVRLSVVGVEECEDGQTSASAAPTSTDLQTMQSTVDSVATSLSLSTAIPIVSTDLSEATSLVGFTTLVPPSLEPTQTRPAQISSFRFSNTSTVVFPTVPIETSEDFSFPNIPGVTFTPLDEATTADALPTDVISSESQRPTDDATSSLPEVTTSTVPEIGTPTSESSVSTSGTSTTVDIETTIDMETTISIENTISSETTSTTATLESASTLDITTEISTTTSEAETTTTTSPPSRACESYLVNPTVLFSGDEDNEDGVEELTLPFPVGIYTESSETIYVGVNGLISLFDNSIAQSSNNPFPDNGLPSVAIAAYWDNLRIKGNAGYEITYRVYDDADYRAVNIDWCVVDGDDVVTHFMVILRAYDLSNPESVFMRYFQSNGGKSATIAVQNLADAKSEQFSYNMENAVPDGCTVLFFTIGGDERVVYVPP